MASFSQVSGQSTADAMIADEVRDGGGELARLGDMVARSLVMQRLLSRLKHSAQHLRIVAIEGEAGTGKAITARTLHALGAASQAAFVACSASRFISAETQSVLEEVRGGALFLTRIHDLGADQQSRLVDFLEWWEHRSGRDATGFFPRQLFVSSCKPLRQMSASGELRADLCYRLTAIRFELPPLRERRDDIGALADWFATRCGAAHGKPVRGLGQGSLARLLSHNWPGNVRELETIITNAAMNCPGQWIRPIDIPSLTTVVAPETQPQDSVVENDPNLDRMILRHVTEVLAKTGGNKLRAARLLGISRSTLYRLLDSGSLAS
ncbi:sigma-54-dependent Fis family transcriptional regulator [Alloacidobacterium dinghuense]|uniref:Sigma-54-dependent Fis family transcriptional regulator n=1 Tax=Alloacidobacterium dinghuense TaxID=2763107 RepID=A0A7G8BCK6_9BACT|nr:sigma 54-interacting transcriptional regulator [Alloacidobacterium dinghuense]QNI30276.1 sigma-54-dependent Fis family transcriptional regulator [Alloacidobacterium dinghuense]